MPCQTEVGATGAHKVTNYDDGEALVYQRNIVAGRGVFFEVDGFVLKVSIFILKSLFWRLAQNSTKMRAPARVWQGFQNIGHQLQNKAK